MITVQNNWDSYKKIIDKTVRQFMTNLDEGKYHPNTYIFYGEKVKSDGFLTWEKEIVKNPYTGQPVSPLYSLAPDSKIVQLPDGERCKYILTQSDTAGDGTVPVESLNEIKTHPLLKGCLATNVDHQDAYKISSPYPEEYSEAIKFTLQSIIKIVQEVDIHAAD